MTLFSDAEAQFFLGFSALISYERSHVEELESSDFRGTVKYYDIDLTLNVV